MEKKCSGCAAEMQESNGVELWGSWFCSRCFISQSGQLHKELRPEDIELLRRIGHELRGFLPPDFIEMVLVGFYQRASGSKTPPDRAELSRCIAEIQRMTAFATFRHVLNLLKTWQDMFNEFVDGQTEEIRDKTKKLTEFEG